MFKKEFRHILRDSRSLIMALFLPLFQMLLFGYALKLDVDRIPTLIFDGDPSADSAALLTSLTIAREWEMGTMEQLLSTPVRAAEIVMGKMLAFFVVGLADTTIAVLVGIFVYGVPFRGSPWVLALTTMIFLSGAFFWGILVSALARSQLFAFQLGLACANVPPPESQTPHIS